MSAASSPCCALSRPTGRWESGMPGTRSRQMQGAVLRRQCLRSAAAAPALSRQGARPGRWQLPANLNPFLLVQAGSSSSTSSALALRRTGAPSLQQQHLLTARRSRPEGLAALRGGEWVVGWLLPPRDDDGCVPCAYGVGWRSGARESKLCTPRWPARRSGCWCIHRALMIHRDPFLSHLPFPSDRGGDLPSRAAPGCL